MRASELDLREALTAVRGRDLERLGEVVEANAMGMHASMMAARPAVVYWLPQTLEVLQAVRDLRAQGLPAWATMDAGPNVKVLTGGASAEAVAAALHERLPGVALWVRRPGGGVRVEASGARAAAS